VSDAATHELALLLARPAAIAVPRWDVSSSAGGAGQRSAHDFAMRCPWLRALLPPAAAANQVLLVSALATELA
jgi:hypothetical protein